MLKYILANMHHQLVTNAGKALSLPSSLVPFFVQKKLLSHLLERVLAEAIYDGDLAFLQNKWLKIEVSDLQLKWYLSFAQDKLIIEEDLRHQDVSFCGNVNDLILVASRKEDPDTLFFQRRLSIQGDTELGLEVKNLLDNIDFDNLSPLAQKALDSFATFIQKGLIAPAATQATAEA